MHLDQLPEELKNTRIVPALPDDKELLRSLGEGNLNILFDAVITFGDERDRYSAIDQNGRYRVKELGDLFEDPTQEDLEIQVTMKMHLEKTKDRKINPEVRVFNASPSSFIEYFRLGSIVQENDSFNASDSKNDELPKFETECILLGYYHPTKKSEGLQLATIEAWRVDGVLIGDCDTSKGIKRLTKAMRLDERYQEAGLSKKELQKLVDFAIAEDDVDLKEGVPMLPWYTFNKYSPVAPGKKKKARSGRQEVHLLIRIIDLRGQEAACTGTIVLKLGCSRRTTVSLNS